MTSQLTSIAQQALPHSLSVYGFAEFCHSSLIFLETLQVTLVKHPTFLMICLRAHVVSTHHKQGLLCSWLPMPTPAPAPCPPPLPLVFAGLG